MNSGNLQSQYIMSGEITSGNVYGRNFGQSVKWLSSDMFGAVYTSTTGSIDSLISFDDGTLFDDNNSQFGNTIPSFNQCISIYQILKTDGSWIGAYDNILNPARVSNITISGGANNTSAIYDGQVDNIFVLDKNNPDIQIAIYNNLDLSHGWTLSTPSEARIDSSSISSAWIYDAETKEKVTDVEVVDLYHGVLPSDLTKNLDYICDIDPAVYNIPQWKPGTIYSIDDVVNYGGILYKALYSGKSGSVFSTDLWNNLGSITTQNAGLTYWGSSYEGKTWFKTDLLKVIDGQVGTLEERYQNWNDWFPSTSIKVYEWVISTNDPTDYVQSDDTGYLESVDIPYMYDSVSKKYGFWVYGKTANGTLHKIAISSLADSIGDIPNSGIPIISAIDTNSVAVWNINSYVAAYTAILHIEYISESSHNKIHNEFALIGNNGTKSWIETPIYQKFIDSLCGASEETEQLVPDYTLPSQQQIGIFSNPSQTLFSDRVLAIKTYFEIVNSHLANSAVATSNIISSLSDFDPAPADYDILVDTYESLEEMNPDEYDESIRILVQSDSSIFNNNWSVVYSDGDDWIYDRSCTYDLRDKWEYSDWYANNYSSSNVATYTIDSIGELPKITYVSGDTIQVNDNGITYMAVENSLNNAVIDLEPVYIENGTIQFTKNLYDFNYSNIGYGEASFGSTSYDSEPYLEIRKIVRILNEIVLTLNEELSSAADAAFFSMIKYILYENSNLDWLFKTSFVTVDYNNRDLMTETNFEADNEDDIKNFMYETLPFHARIREFNNKYTGTEYGNVGVSDFDLPSQFDTNYYNMILATTNNPKMNSPFLPNCGVYGTANTMYVTSNITSNIASKTWKFAFDLVPSNNSAIQYSTFSTNYGSNVDLIMNNVDQSLGNAFPNALAIDGVPVYGPNKGNAVVVYYNANLATSEKHLINEAAAANVANGIVDQYGVLSYITLPEYLLGDSSSHSPIIGFALDGNPIYGPYGYANANSTIIIKQTSSYALSNIARLESSEIYNGLFVGNYTSPDGKYVDDYIYVEGSGTLDENNGKYCITPEYPNGTYAYFSTNTYPYVIGPTFRGIPYNLRYLYINNESIPFYPNGAVTIPFESVANTLSFIRSVDGSQLTDANTLSNTSVYSAWYNNYDYTISNLRVVDPGEGYINTSANIYASGANIVVKNIRLVEANIKSLGFDYSANDILELPSDAGNIIIDTVFSNGAIKSFNTEFADITYTSASSYIGVVPTNVTSNGSGATFNFKFGINDFTIYDGGSFTSTPTIIISDDYANVEATVVATLENSLVRELTSNIRFDRVSSNIELGESNIVYQTGSIVYLTANSAFMQATSNTTIGNVSEWTTANSESIATTTAANRIFAAYTPNANMRGNNYGHASNLTIESIPFSPTYTPPISTIFDYDYIDDSNVVLNLSWKPQQLNDSILSHEFPRFGNSSGYFNNSYIVANTGSTDINLGNANFTLEFFVRLNDLSNITILDGRTSNSSNMGAVISSSNGSIILTTANINITSNVEVSANNWNYIMIAGNTSNVEMYLNGNIVGISNASYDITDNALTLGASVDGGNIMNGYMDELRITKKFNRYANVASAIPSEPFPRSEYSDNYFSYTPILYGFESMTNESKLISFTGINSTKYVSDLSWNQKQLTIVGNVTVDGTSNDYIMLVKINE
jgi:hypothetical protein